MRVVAVIVGINMFYIWDLAFNHGAWARVTILGFVRAMHSIGVV